jgi:hypothetical protein
LTTDDAQNRQASDPFSLILEHIRQSNRTDMADNDNDNVAAQVAVQVAAEVAVGITERVRAPTLPISGCVACIVGIIKQTHVQSNSP